MHETPQPEALAREVIREAFEAAMRRANSHTWEPLPFELGETGECYASPWMQKHFADFSLGYRAAYDALRPAAVSNEQRTGKHRCPNCGTKFEYIADVDAHLASLTPAQEEKPDEVTADYSEQALADRCINFLEERAEVWMAEEGVQRMFNAIASVFEKWASQEIMDRFREQLRVIGLQCHVEGALRVWEEIAAQQRALGQPLPPPPAIESLIPAEPSSEGEG